MPEEKKEDTEKLLDRIDYNDRNIDTVLKNINDMPINSITEAAKEADDINKLKDKFKIAKLTEKVKSIVVTKVARERVADIRNKTIKIGNIQTLSKRFKLVEVREHIPAKSNDTVTKAEENKTHEAPSIETPKVEKQRMEVKKTEPVSTIIQKMSESLKPPTVEPREEGTCKDDTPINRSEPRSGNRGILDNNVVRNTIDIATDVAKKAVEISKDVIGKVSDIVKTAIEQGKIKKLEAGKQTADNQPTVVANSSSGATPKTSSILVENMDVDHDELEENVEKLQRGKDKRRGEAPEQRRAVANASDGRVDQGKEEY